MKRADELNDKGYVQFNTQHDGALIEEDEQAKPQVTSRVGDDVSASVQAAEEASSEKP